MAVVTLGLAVLFAGGRSVVGLAAEGETKPNPKSTPPPHPNGPAVAASDLARMTPGDGVEATLFASEPMVVNPADMDIDERGRVWITEGANYRASFQKWGILRPGGDRIVILEDADHDGRAEQQTVFYQDMTVNTALGICVLGNKVIVSSSPYVFVLTDSDLDGKADRRQLLFEDTSKGDHDHCTHAFVFGPDGKLYFNFGNEVKELRRPKGGTMDLPLNGPVPKHEAETVIDLSGHPVKTDGKPYRQGMAFRCDLDGANVESIGWNFRNNYELAVDSFGTVWQSDNDDDGNRGVRINFVMEFGNYGYTDELTGAGWGTAWKKAQTKGAKEDERPLYHWHQSDPGVVPNLLQTGNGSPTGICIYEGNLLPAIYRNQMVHCDAGPRVVRAYPVQPAGAGYTATTSNLLTSGDAWYRPADVCVAPDGSIYIADWHDAGVGGHNMADRALETMTGRVYRVAPKGTQPSVPKLDLETAEGCAAALQSPNQATRFLAWTKLHDLQGRAEGVLTAMWMKGEPRMRARAIQLLARIPSREKRYVNEALKDQDPDLRIVGLRMARALKLDLIPILQTLASDSSPAVRRECAVALRHQKSADVPKLWTSLARQFDGKDRWYLEALGLAMDGQEEACFSAWLTTVGDQWNTPAGREIIWRSRSTKAPALLAKIVTDKGTSAADKERFLRALDYIKGPEKDAALVEISTALLN
jgi:putative membrane-bound dehydrogenase-like protein